MKFLLFLAWIGLSSSAIVPKQLPSAVKDEDESFLTTPEMIAADGYPVESHYTTTSDGYILNLHRIPSGKTGKSNGKVAFVQHGLLCSSADWVVAGPEKSLGYILADEGYDVWLGNFRGNFYSRNHTSLDPDSSTDFWQFSWHEMGNVDLPTMIDYVLEQTGVDGVHYVGHSQGTTTFYVMTATRPEYNDKIKVQVSLAPIAFMKHMTSPLMKILSVFEGPIEALASLIGVNEFLPSTDFLHSAAEDICSIEGLETLCENALFAVCGFDSKQMNLTLLPKILEHVPAGTSTKQFLHYAQEINSGYFRQYDFGSVENLEKYGKLSPPDYEISQITAPVYLIYSKNDWLAGVEDVNTLCEGIGNCEKILVGDDSFNHVDYTYAIDAPSLVYNKVVSFFDQY